MAINQNGNKPRWRKVADSRRSVVHTAEPTLCTTQFPSPTSVVFVFVVDVVVFVVNVVVFVVDVVVYVVFGVGEIFAVVVIGVVVGGVVILF